MFNIVKQTKVRKVNFTGKPLSEDMKDEKTFDPVLDICSDCLVHLTRDIMASTSYLHENKDLYDYVIIENNALGRALFNTFAPNVKFVLSWKKRGTTDHEYWHQVERLTYNPKEQETLQSV